MCGGHFIKYVMYFISELNKVYVRETALFEKDYAEDGFCWIDCVKDGTCTYTMKRTGKNLRSIYLFMELQRVMWSYI